MLTLGFTKVTAAHAQTGSWLVFAEKIVVPNLLVMAFVAFKVGEWVGVRSRRKAELVIVAAIAIDAVLDRSLNMLLQLRMSERPRSFSEQGMMESGYGQMHTPDLLLWGGFMAVLMTIIFGTIGVVGVRRGKRASFNRYILSVFNRLPTADQKAVTDLIEQNLTAGQATSRDGGTEMNRPPPDPNSPPT